MRSLIFVLAFASCVDLWLGGDGQARATGATPAVLNPNSGAISLTGLWRFAIGDDPLRSRPDFNDAAWEAVHLTPKPQARDADVGLEGYMPGWSARGHGGYDGFAWYRRPIDFSAASRDLAIAGPTMVDSAYQIYWDGRLVGGIGDFSQTPPIAYGIHPQRFHLGGVPAGRHWIAIRTWLDPSEAGSPEAGGLHVTPTIGERPEISGLVGREWTDTFKGYVVDAVEPLAFLLLAVWAVLARRHDAARARSVWLAMALMLTALTRANQPLFYWSGRESLHAYDALRNVIEAPAALAAWMIAIRAWLDPKRSVVVPVVAVALGLALAISQVLSRSWLTIFSTDSKQFLHAISADLRLAFAGLFLSLLVWGAARRRADETVFLTSSAVLVGTGLFADELSRMHLKSIWFVFGTGVSRTQLAYAAATAALAMLLISDRHRAEPATVLAHSPP
ncbi:hypothetical protein [Phenylobacterium sp.]|uniref:hypothetical protein n=1 Tax=Phenylobacterium sp. TaxID=1871053 RepID=UPI00120AEF1F|nr:hypothetical protein [Phenylobacterium sp.]THD60106.1 MAG: glycoside hydrolase [Phenylobacterium sp.]